MKTKKILANTLCASMMIGNITPAFAVVTNETDTYEDTTENISKETEVLYEKAGNYFVTIPKTISLGTDKQSPYSVKVEGDISSDKQVYVSPIDGIKDTEDFDFYMHDQNTSHPKADVIATVTQNKFYWNFNEVANGYTETNNKVTALNLTSGTWKGTFDFEINMNNVDDSELHKHSYTETILKEPTCTEEGEKKLTCSCGDSKTESIPSTGHNIVDGNCTDCDVIVKTVTDLMAGRDISFDMGTVLAVDKADTLKVNDIVIPEQNFTFDKEGEYEVTVETVDPETNNPTIININITVIINESHTHNYTETIIKNATCTENGEKKLTCSCGDNKTEVIPATGHIYENGKCTECGEADPNHQHSYTETITKQAGCEEEGLKTLTCVCGDGKTEVIPATGHDYEDGNCKNCGDTEYIQHEHNFANNTYNTNWIRDFDGTSGYRWDYESATANSTRYKSNSTSGVIGSWNAAETIWKITVPVSCTTEIGFKPNTTSGTTNPTTYIYLNDEEVWNNFDSYASSNEYRYRTVKLQPGDNYIRAVGYRNDCIELFKVAGEYEVCSICGEKPLSKIWNYTGKTITLNRYIGEETDVIVQSTYQIDGTTYKTKIAANTQGWSTDYMFGRKNIKTVTFEKNIELPDSIAAMFRECSSLTNVDMSNLDTSNVANMSSMFYKCTSLADINLGGLDTRNVTNISSMFSGCSNLTNINLSGLDTDNVNSMGNMFSGCSGLTSINLSGLNTSNVTDMSSMFFGCSSLTNLDVSNLDTSNVKFMNSMFNGCSSLASLDLSNFNTTNLTNMYRMFYGCSSLASLDLSNFETSQVINMDSIFYGCTSLNTIYVTQNKWLTSQADTTNMFKNCGTSSVIYK